MTKNVCCFPETVQRPMHILKHITLETVLGGMHYYLPCLSDDSGERDIVEVHKGCGQHSWALCNHCGLCPKFKAFQSQNINRVCVSLG